MYTLKLVALVGLLVLPLVLSEAPDKAKAQASIPMPFRVPCGNSHGWLTPDCDGRTQYCDDAGVLRCASCESICQPDQSTFQCQKACKIYLDFNEKTARDQALDAKLDALDARGVNDRKEMQNQLDKIIYRDEILIGFVVLIGFVLVCVALPLLIFVAWNIKEHNRAQYGPLAQTSDADRKLDQESGIQTGTNTPDSMRRNNSITQNGTGIEAGAEVHAEGQPSSVFGHPTDAVAVQVQV